MGKVISLIIVALLIVWAVSAMRDDEPTVEPTTVDVTTNVVDGETDAVDATVVTYNGKTFTPSPVTIQAGQSVTFINSSDSSVWIASAPHPTHTDLPGFDSKEAIGSGESYTFTFTKTGSWNYHNHLNSAQSGTVIVQ